MGAFPGFLRAAIQIDKPGPAVYGVVADVRPIEYSPDGSCCQSIYGQAWPRENAWSSVGGDVIAQNATDMTSGASCARRRSTGPTMGSSHVEARTGWK